MQLNLKLKEYIFTIMIPSIGFTSAYLYMLGRYTFLNIPHELIQITLEIIVVSSISVLLFLALAIFIVYLLDLFDPLMQDLLTYIPHYDKFSEKQKILIQRLMVTLYIILFITFAFPSSHHTIYAMLAFTLIIIIISHFSPKLELNYTPSFSDIISTTTDPKLDFMKYIEVFIDKINLKGALLLILAYLLLSFLTGIFFIKYGTTFWMYNYENIKYLYGGKIDDELILVKINNEDNSLTKIIYLKQIDNTELRKEPYTTK